MRVVCYLTEDPSAPLANRAVALIFHADNKAHPVMIFGATMVEARTRAATWLAAELERARPKERKPRKPAAAPEPDTVDEAI